MLPLYILFAEITAVVCAVGAIIFCILLFSDWEEKGNHSDHTHEEHIHDHGAEAHDLHH